MLSMQPSSERRSARRSARKIGRLTRGCGIAWLALAGFVLGHSPTLGDSPLPDLPEYEVKAAFIYNFAKFVEWPREAFRGSDADLRVGIVGKDPFGEIIDRVIDGKTAQGRALAVHRVKDSEGRFQCQILFVGKMPSRDLEAVLRAVDERPILTVSESLAFIRAGGIVRLKIANNKVRFEINLDAARKAGLRISSDLLRLADRIDEAPG